MNKTATCVDTLIHESLEDLARIHEESDEDNRLLAQANAIINTLPADQANILRRAYRTAAKYGGMDTIEAEAVSRLVRDSCRQAALAA